MDKYVFNTVIVDLAAFYERNKQPSSNTLDLWYKKVKSIPDESLNWIKDKIYEEYEYFPRNLVAALWSQYHAWIDSHPEKRAIKTYRDCPDCFQGIITCHRKIENLHYRYFFRCLRCKQDDTRAWPEAFKANLMQKGYLFNYVPEKPIDRYIVRRHEEKTDMRNILKAQMEQLQETESPF